MRLVGLPTQTPTGHIDGCAQHGTHDLHRCVRSHAAAGGGRRRRAAIAIACLCLHQHLGICGATPTTHNACGSCTAALLVSISGAAL